MMPQPEAAPTALEKSPGVSTRPAACSARAARPEPENRNITAMATRACIVMMGTCRATRWPSRVVLALTST